jgi:hypothetical protein
MAWTRLYHCPQGHAFEDKPGLSYNARMKWITSECEQCSKQTWPRQPVYYSRDEWTQGQRKLELAATVINMRLMGKKVRCDFCNKEIPMHNDRAFHLQKHFSVAITLDDAKFLKEVA